MDDWKSKKKCIELVPLNNLVIGPKCVKKSCNFFHSNNGRSTTKHIFGLS